LNEKDDRKRKKKTLTATINTVRGDEWWYSNVIIIVGELNTEVTMLRVMDEQGLK
jgi:hypothetical protein